MRQPRTTNMTIITAMIAGTITAMIMTRMVTTIMATAITATIIRRALRECGLRAGEC